MRTKREYINGLKMKRNIYFDGQLIDRDDELQMPCLTLSDDYDEAAKPENELLMTATSHLTGRESTFSITFNRHDRPA